MSDPWHGYFIVERHNISLGNWGDLQLLFDIMGTHTSSIPAHNLHRRTRLDDDAVLYESRFNPDEVSIDTFKQMLSDEFGVPVGDIGHGVDSADYAGHGTTIWTFSYNAQPRFSVQRLGRGGTWEQCRQETVAYLKLHQADWEPL